MSAPRKPALDACGFAAVILLLSACGGLNRLAGDIPGSGSLVPDTTFKLTPSTSIALDKIINWGAYAGVAYLILDPLAPNWEIEEAKFPNDHIHLSLRMKRYYAGGAGEARSMFHRRALELARAGDYAGYQVIEYSESIESSVLGSQRVVTGVVQMTGKPLG